MARRQLLEAGASSLPRPPWLSGSQPPSAADLMTARAGGLSWPQISRAMGLASAQAAQQRFGRVTRRVEHRGA